MSLTDVLPVEPVIPTTGQSSARRHAVASVCSAAKRIRRREDPTAAGRTAREPLRPLRVDDHSPGACLERRRRVLATVGSLSAKAEEEVARLDVPRIDGRPLRPLGPSLGDDGSAGPGDEPIRGEVDHAA